MLMHRPQTPQPGFGSIILLQKFTPHFKILDPRLFSDSYFPQNNKLLVLSHHLNSDNAKVCHFEQKKKQINKCIPWSILAEIGAQGWREQILRTFLSWTVLIRFFLWSSPTGIFVQRQRFPSLRAEGRALISLVPLKAKEIYIYYMEMCLLAGLKLFNFGIFSLLLLQ